MATLFDDFSSGSISGAKWATTTTGGATAVVTSSQLVLTSNNQEAWLRSVPSVNVTGDWVGYEIISPDVDFTDYCYLQVVDAVSPLRRIRARLTGTGGNTVYLDTYDAAGASAASTNAGFNTVSTPCIRIREASGTFYLESATTMGGSWSAVASLAVPSGFVLTDANFDVGLLPDGANRTWTLDNVWAPSAASTFFRPYFITG